MRKTIITNRAALAGKYGSGHDVIDAALDRMIELDARRGVKTILADLEDVRPGDPKQNKNAVDAAALATRANALLILGAADVVPHQDLINPLYTGPDGPDSDEVAWSDLPYASAAPYSRDPGQFLRPTRMVGRLPDLLGGSDASYLAALIEHAATWTSRPREQYLEPFSVSAQAWEKSTAISLVNVFRSNATLVTSPGHGPDWSSGELARLSYFINLHGGEKAPALYGEAEDRDTLPVALEPSALDGRVSRGAVAAIESSYAGEHVASSFASAFLRNGGSGCFVSTTSTYGSAEANAHADILCQRFLANVLEGMTLGFAAMNAWLDFIRTLSVLGPVDLKTIAQFYLAGDPSIRPVEEAGERTRSLAGMSVPVWPPGAIDPDRAVVTEHATTEHAAAAAMEESAPAASAALTYDVAQVAHPEQHAAFRVAFGRTRKTKAGRAYDVEQVHEHEGRADRVVSHRK